MTSSSVDRDDRCMFVIRKLYKNKDKDDKVMFLDDDNKKLPFNNSALAETKILNQISN